MKYDLIVKYQEYNFTTLRQSACNELETFLWSIINLER